MTRLVRLVAVVPLLAASLAFAADPSVAEQRPQFPDTPAGQRLGEWLTAFGSGDPEALLRFHRDRVSKAHLPPEQRAEMHFQMAQFSGGLDVTAVKSVSETAVEAEALTKFTGDRVTLNVEVDPAEPHGVIGFTFRMLPAEDPSPGRLSEEEIASRLEAHLDRLASADAFSGVVLVAKEGKPIFARAYGLADREANVPNRLDTKFSLASMGKMFTAVAVLRLADEGKLSLSDTIGKHLPGYPNKAVAEKVTIEQLLTHTSGLGDFFGKKWNERGASVRTLDDHLAIFADEELAFEPGKQWRYSNAGYVVLGAIIETVTAKRFADVITEQVFQPAGMTDSGYFAAEENVAKRAVGYSRMGLDGKPNAGGALAPVTLDAGGPAGGGWSTAGDLLKFAEALRTHTLLDAETTARATGPRVETQQGPGAAYGYGFEIQSVGGKHVFGHYGGFLGVSTGFEVYPELGYTVVILSNSDMGGQRVIGPLHGWLGRE